MPHGFVGGSAMPILPIFDKIPNHLIPIHPDNAATNDWIILLEANTVVGPSGGRLRVARTIQEHKIVKRFRWFHRQPFLVVEGYDPRIHTLYFCPQLYKRDEDERLVPLEGEEIGSLIADALGQAVKSRLPWYGPTDQLPNDPIITGDVVREFDTLVVDKPPKKPTLVASAAN
jgi:hypothetical protein